jgi:hypothetical protein
MNKGCVEAGLGPVRAAARPQPNEFAAPDRVMDQVPHNLEDGRLRPSSPDEDVRAYAIGVKQSSMNLLLESNGNGLGFRP